MQIEIAHVAGSKVNLTEHFALENYPEITIGRRPDCVLRFDETRDDSVSRLHAIIRWAGGDSIRFTIVDQNSTNKTKVNGREVVGEAELLPGDEVEVGRAKFRFDVTPRPPHLVRRTAHISTVVAQQATRTIDADPAGAATGDRSAERPAAARPFVSRDTMERHVEDLRQQGLAEVAGARRAANQRLMFGLAGLLVLVAVGVAGAYTYMRRHVDEAVAANRPVPPPTQLSSEDIMARNRKSVVRIKMEWSLTDRLSGKKIYWKQSRGVPCYVALDDKTVVPWLTTEDDDRTNLVIGESGWGSGFVVRPDGFILTNHHVVESWNYIYIPAGVVASDNKVRIARPQKLCEEGDLVDVAKPDARFQPLVAILIDYVNKWIPGNGGVLFETKPAVSKGAAKFDATSRIDVVFPDESTLRLAKLDHVSQSADLAVVKIDTANPLPALTMSSSSRVNDGTKVVVIGYPSFSPNRYVVSEQTGMNAGAQKVAVEANPTVTDGIVTQYEEKTKSNGAGTTTVGDMEEMYQLSVPTTSGNSGGPVFDARGEVIGVLTSGATDSAVPVTYAVPIKFGLQLL
jgi:serine protease Do